MRTLHLTSPFMRGEDVRRLQRALMSKGWLTGTTDDGEYGPLTAQAVHRGKFWLGYNKPDQSAADLFLSYVEGTREPTDAMKERARKRKAAQQAKPLRLKALEWLLRHIGEKENPAGSNRIPWASTWYGIIGPWCAMAVTRAYVDSGSRAFARAKRYAFVPFIVNDAHHGINSLALTKTPMSGDLCCFDWEGNGVADHVGLFIRWLDAEHTRFETVEGNTGIGNDSNGGEVMKRERQVTQLQRVGSLRAFVHVGT